MQYLDHIMDGSDKIHTCWPVYNLMQWFLTAGVCFPRGASIHFKGVQALMRTETWKVRSRN